MRIKIEYLFVVCAILCSCNKKASREDFFADKKMIYGKTFDANCLIGRPAEIVSADPYLFYHDRYEGETVTILDTRNSMFVRRFLKEGQGPEDVISPLKLSVSGNGNLNVFQMQSGRLNEYKISDIVANKEISVFRKYRFEDRPANIQKTVDGFVGIGMYEDGRYRLYDETGKAVREIGDYPFRGKDMKPQERFFLYQGILCSSPDGSHFALGTSYCDNLEFFKMENGDVSLVRKYETGDVKGHYGQGIILDDNCVMAYKGAYGTGRYCYMLYSGEMFGERHVRTTGGNTIIVFDWNGEYVKTFETDKTVFSFCVDRTDSSLYAITRDEKDEFLITVFDL